MRFYLFDSIIEYELGARAVGVKNISSGEDFLKDHYERKPLMPAPLVVESLAQLGGWLVTVSGGYRHLAIMVMLKNISAPGDAGPGDRVELQVELESINDYGASVRARACAGSREIVSVGSITYVLYEIPEAEQPSVRERYERLAGDRLKGQRERGQRW